MFLSRVFLAGSKDFDVCTMQCALSALMRPFPLVLVDDPVTQLSIARCIP